MTYSEFKERAKQFFREQLSVTDYIDVLAASANIRSNIPFRGPNIYILFVAIVIASVGLNVNSIPVIIGAMLISPLMSPIIGFGMGLGTNDTDLLLQSLKNLGIMFAISLLASTLYFVVTPLETDNPTELLARTNPSVYDVLIATVGYGIASLNWQYAAGALYLFFINCIFIALATFLAVKYLRFPVVEEKDGTSRRRIISYVLLILVVLVPSFFTAYSIVRENRFTTEARHFVKENQAVGGTYIYDYSTDMSVKPYTLTLRLAGEALSPESRAQLYTNAEKHGISHAQILFQEDATIEVRRLNETEVMRDWLASTEQQLRQRDDSIKALRQQLDAYEALVLPTEQISNELRAQWSSIDRITLARADSTVLLVISEKPAAHHKQEMLRPEDLARMEQWLAIRLNVPSVQVIKTN